MKQLRPQCYPWLPQKLHCYFHEGWIVWFEVTARIECLNYQHFNDFFRGLATWVLLVNDYLSQSLTLRGPGQGQHANLKLTGNLPLLLVFPVMTLATQLQLRVPVLVLCNTKPQNTHLEGWDVSSNIHLLVCTTFITRTIYYVLYKCYPVGCIPHKHLIYSNNSWYKVEVLFSFITTTVREQRPR